MTSKVFGLLISALCVVAALTMAVLATPQAGAHPNHGFIGATPTPVPAPDDGIADPVERSEITVTAPDTPGPLDPVDIEVAVPAATDDTTAAAEQPDASLLPAADSPPAVNAAPGARPGLAFTG